MNMKMHEEVVESIRKTEHSMRVEVKIPRDEVDRITVNRLIGITNSLVNSDRDMSHIDKTIRFFLTEDEFDKYVVNQEPIGY